MSKWKKEKKKKKRLKVFKNSIAIEVEAENLSTNHHRKNEIRIMKKDREKEKTFIGFVVEIKSYEDGRA